MDVRTNTPFLTKKAQTIQRTSQDSAQYKIGILSDTHGLLREDVLNILHTCDAILHGGDFHNLQTFEQLSSIAPLYAVRGNTDKEWAQNLPKTLSLELYSIKIFMIHNKKQIKEDIQNHDLIIYGHSHKYAQTQLPGQIWLNPGSCGPRRFSLPVTMALLHTSGNGTFEIEQLTLHTPVSRSRQPSTDDMKNLVLNIMKETDKGRPVEAIAKKYRITEDLADRICRLYLTHPGVDADGILRKMGL